MAILASQSASVFPASEAIVDIDQSHRFAPGWQYDAGWLAQERRKINDYVGMRRTSRLDADGRPQQGAPLSFVR